MKIHLTQHLHRGICSLHQQGLAALGKRSLYNCNIHSQISLASSWRYVSHLVPQEPGSELPLNLFLVFRSGRAGQIFFLDFSKDGPANFGDEFTYGDTVRMCTFLLFPGVSLLLPVSIQLLRASQNLRLPS